MSGDDVKAIDDLPGQRCANALALLVFLRQVPMEYFVDGTDSGRAALDLSAAGYLKLVRVRDGNVELLKVVGGIGGAN